MEKKLNEKTNELEKAEEENVQMREGMEMMAKKIESIEVQFEDMLRDKDYQIKKWKQKYDILEKQKRMLEDMEDLQTTNKKLKDESDTSADEIKENSLRKSNQ